MHRPAGNKNAALPVIAATLLADGPVQLRNIPRIRDVETLVEILVDLGATATWGDGGDLAVDTRGAQLKPLDPVLCARIRASILLAGPLLARFGSVTLPPPGGDVIGRRRIDTHFLALERLGARVTVGDRYEIEAKHLTGADIFLDEPSVTGTENALMAAVMAKGRTVLRNAAAEPHVQDTARVLVAMGARIEGIGSNTYTIDGGHPSRGAEYEIGPDHIEIGSFIGLAAVTDGDITIEGVRGRRPPLARSSASSVSGSRRGSTAADLVVSHGQERRVRPDLGGHVPKLEDGPWPAFPADVMSIAIVTATQCEGMVLIHEKMFESTAVLRGQADRHGRTHRTLRPAPRGDQRPGSAARRDGGVARHPRRHGDAARCARGRGARARSTTSARSNVATRILINASGPSAPTFSDWMTEPPPASSPRSDWRGPSLDGPSRAGGNDSGSLRG